MRYNVVIGSIVESSSDALINFAFNNLKSGPEPFADIVKYAQSQAYYTLYGHVGHLKDGDCVGTIPGQLDTGILVTSIYSNDPSIINTLVFNIKETLKTYSKQDNLCRFVSMTIPNMSYLNDFMYYINTYFQEIESLRELTIYVKSSFHRELVLNALPKENKTSKFISVLKWLGGIFNKKRNGFTFNRQKKLQKGSKRTRHK